MRPAALTPAVRIISISGYSPSASFPELGLREDHHEDVVEVACAMPAARRPNRLGLGRLAELLLELVLVCDVLHKLNHLRHGAVGIEESRGGDGADPSLAPRVWEGPQGLRRTSPSANVRRQGQPAQGSSGPDRGRPGRARPSRRSSTGRICCIRGLATITRMSSSTTKVPGRGCGQPRRRAPARRAPPPRPP